MLWPSQSVCLQLWNSCPSKWDRQDGPPWGMGRGRERVRLHSLSPSDPFHFGWHPRAFPVIMKTPENGWDCCVISKMQVPSCFLRNYNRDTSKVMALGFMRPEDALGAWWGPGEDADRRFCQGQFWDIGFYGVGLCLQLTCWEVVGTKEANLSENAVTLELVTAWGSQWAGTWGRIMPGIRASSWVSWALGLSSNRQRWQKTTRQRGCWPCVSSHKVSLSFLYLGKQEARRWCWRCWKGDHGSSWLQIFPGAPLLRWGQPWHPPIEPGPLSIRSTFAFLKLGRWSPWPHL